MDTLFIGNQIIKLNSVDSTNSFLKSLILEQTMHEGLVVIANSQKKGRGQRNNVWHSKAGLNLLLSIYLKPNINVNEQFLLNKIISLAVFDTVNYFYKKKEIKIKWPNDILVNDNKISGILIENFLQKKNIKQSIIGIGLNINQVIFNKLQKVTSLKKLTKQTYNLDKITVIICKNIEKYYSLLKTNKTLLNSNYHKNLYKLNEKCNFLIDKENKIKKILGVHESGKIILKDVNEENHYGLNEAKFIY